MTSKEIKTKPLQLLTSQREINRFNLKPEQPLFALTSDGGMVKSQDPRVNSVGELLTKVEDLLLEPEAVFCEEILSRILDKSTSSVARLEPQALLSPLEFEAYVYRFKNGGAYLNPTQDFYAVVDETKLPVAYGSRSSLCPPMANISIFSQKLMNIPDEPVCTGGVQPCLRNEVIYEQEKIRFPWFTQTDIELIAITSLDQQENQEILLDTYSCYQMIKALELAGIPNKSIEIRINNYMQILNNVLGDQVPWLEKEIFGYQSLNNLSALKAARKTETDEYRIEQKQSLNKLSNFCKKFDVPEEAQAFFSNIITKGGYDFSCLSDNPGESPEIITNFNYIDAIQAYLRLITTSTLLRNFFPGRQICKIDPLSYRGGFPGYDKTTMQIDVILPNDQVMIEVGGGGAYPNSLQTAAEVLGDSYLNQPQSYAVGFALGNARVYSAMEKFLPSPQVNSTVSVLSWNEFLEVCNQ
ncbi:MAG: hypothetical protein ABIJ43_02185 [Candidatus Beckwithbacteria bacterium]|nr:hypothetical protein [Patescibacteria group bacterium]